MPIEQQFITKHFREWEGRKTKAYIPCYVKVEAQARIGKTSRNYTGDNGFPDDYTVMGVSGVTIGTGCDLGQQTAAGLRAMGVPSDLVAKFMPYIGKSKDAAIRALHDAPFSITDIECDTLDYAVHGDYVKRIAQLYDKASIMPFSDIPKEAQAVIAHLFYHLGSPTKKYPATWDALVRQDWKTAADKLRNGELWSGPYDNGRASEGRLLATIPGVE